MTYEDEESYDSTPPYSSCRFQKKNPIKIGSKKT